MGNILKPERHWADDEPWDSDQELAICPKISRRRRRRSAKVRSSKKNNSGEERDQDMGQTLGSSTRIKIVITKKQLKALVQQIDHATGARPWEPKLESLQEVSE